jgi:hypothetical protein
VLSKRRHDSRHGDPAGQLRAVPAARPHAAADPEESEGACYTHALNISKEARANRKLLGSVLTSAGLVNYPTEWWHWSFGDRYWALITGEAAALYGPKEMTARRPRPERDR